MKLCKAILLMAAFLLPVPVLAAQEPEIILIGVVAPAPTEAPKMPIQPLQEFDWDAKLIDAVASIYWAETGANGPITSQEKLMITQLIWNRSQHGSPFPEDLLEVCRQRNEFNKGKISDRNRETARSNLDKVRSQAEGYYQGIPVEMTKALYMGRVNGTLTFYDADWQKVFEVK